MHGRTWILAVAIAAVAGAAGGYGVRFLTAPNGPPPTDTDHSAQLNVTVTCQTSWTCNVTLLLGGSLKWTLPIGCDKAPCVVPDLPTFHRWTGTSSCEPFVVDARSAITDTVTVTLCDGGTATASLQASGVAPDRAGRLNVTIACGTASPCNVTLFVEGQEKWTVVVPCASPPCFSAIIPTAYLWVGPTCSALFVEARSEITDSVTVTLCHGQTVTVLLLAEGPASRVIGTSISRSADGTNWTIVFTSIPSGLTTSEALLAIFNTGGATALPFEAFSSLSYAMDGAVFVGDADAFVEVTERLLLSTALYPTGYRIEMSDNLGLLFSGILQ